MKLMCRIAGRWGLSIAVAAAVVLWGAVVAGASESGLSLSIYTDQNHPGFEYTLGEPIELIMVLKNVSGWELNTKKGFSEVELRRSLLVTGPEGKTYAFTEETGTVDPPPAVFIGELTTEPAETLPVGWVRSLTIDDIRELFPFMKTTPGRYLIEAKQGFLRYAWALQTEGLGAMGVINDAGNWNGLVESNKIEVKISPGEGGNIKVRVVESTDGTESPLPQIPVRLFAQADVPSGSPLSDTWKNVEPVLMGTTGFDGWTVWGAGNACIPEAGYTVVACYSNAYEGADIASGDSGWAPGCTGSLETVISFGEDEPPPTMPGDLDGDGDVDRDDLMIILAARNTPAEGPDDPRDLDGDGRITVLDARKLVLMCTRPGCATE